MTQEWLEIGQCNRSECPGTNLGHLMDEKK